MTTKTKLVLGILGAVAVGAAIGLLMAPEKGKKMRKKIKGTANDWANHLSDLFSAGKAEAENLKNKAIKGAKDLKGEAKNSLEKVKESYS